MDRDWLESQLAAGRSIESIAREVGRTRRRSRYWVNKHGLTSQHAARHAPAAASSARALQALVEDGMSIRQIASRLRRERHDRPPLAAAVRAEDAARALRAPRRGRDPPSSCASAAAHGWGAFVRVGRRGALPLRAMQHARRSPTAAGGSRRSSSRRPAALRGSAGSTPTPGRCNSTTRSRDEVVRGQPRRESPARWSGLRAEARKCVLLCANCHARSRLGCWLCRRYGRYRG